MNNIKFRNSKTESLLINSFAFKCQMGCKYNFYAEIAQKEGYGQISKVFADTAGHEFVHARLFFNHLENYPNGAINGVSSYQIGSTEQNLFYAISEEECGFGEIYKNAEIVARKEGFDSIASVFKNVKKAEEHHVIRFKKLYEHLKNNTIFYKDSEQTWSCQKCGYLYKDKEAPNFCPNCYTLKSSFEILCENY